MQEELQIELGTDEEILAVGEKNQVMYTCNTLLLLFFTLFFLYQSVTVKSFSGSFYFGFLMIAFLVTIIFSVRSYRFNQIYLTNKKFIITQKDNISVIQYGEIDSFWFNTVYLKSRRIFFFAYTNLDDIIEQYEEICLSFKHRKFSLKDIVIIFAFLILGYSLKFLPFFHKYFHKYDKTPSNYEELILNKDYYMLYLQKVLKANWKPPKLDYDAKVTVGFQILQDGTIINEKILETSGNKDFDNSALFALKKSNPLRSLSDDLKKEKEVIINFTFDYDAKK